MPEDSSHMYRSPYKNTNRNLRIIGVDDGAFSSRKNRQHKAIIVAVLFENASIMAVRTSRIQVDGRDANRVVRALLRTVRYDVVMLSGIAFAGFNLIDIAKLARATRRPVIAIVGEKPNNTAVRRALRKHFDDWQERWQIVQNAGRLYSFRPLANEPELFFEVKGGSVSFAREAIASSATISRLPEPIRVAGILARGLSVFANPNAP